MSMGPHYLLPGGIFLGSQTIRSSWRSFVLTSLNLICLSQKITRDVNKDLTPKDQDKDKDLTPKDKDKDKDLTPKDQDKDKDLKYVLKDKDEDKDHS